PERGRARDLEACAPRRRTRGRGCREIRPPAGGDPGRVGLHAGPHEDDGELRARDVRRRAPDRADEGERGADGPAQDPDGRGEGVRPRRGHGTSAADRGTAPATGRARQGGRAMTYAVVRLRGHVTLKPKA